MTVSPGFAFNLLMFVIIQEELHRHIVLFADVGSSFRVGLQQRRQPAPQTKH